MSRRVRSNGPRLHCWASFRSTRHRRRRPCRRWAWTRTRPRSWSRPRCAGALEDAVPTDPTIYRLYEIVQVYGPAFKELIHEEFGDGIMSAINFGFTVRREPDPKGDRVEIVLNGKFLPYEWRADER